MKVDITVPAVGESVTEATVAQILKTSGSSVKKDEEIVELETDKVNQVIYAPEDGVLTLSVNVDDKVSIGQVIGQVEPGSQSDTKQEPPKAQEKPKTAPTQQEPPKTQEQPKAEGPQGGGARVSEEEAVTQTPSSPPAPKPETKPSSSPKIAPSDNQERKRMTGLRKTIAQRLVEVKNQTAMLTTFNEVDMQNVMQIRSDRKEEFEKKHGVKLGFLSFFVTACSSALNAFPDVNAFIDGDEIVYNKSQHIGIAVSTEKGLMVPVLRSCEAMTFADIEKGVSEYANKAREGSISINDLQGGTFTITNGGVFGSLLSTPILNPPQSAILGMHKIMKRPVVIDDKIEIRPMMYLALSYDHRIIDGKEAVRFLVHIKECLEDPSRLLLESK